MNKDKRTLLIVTLLSIICVVWALTIPDFVMAALSLINAIISLCFSFLFRNKPEKV